MAEMIGLSKNVLLDWMDLAASCRANNTPKDQTKQILNEKIGETIQSATNIRKIRTILFNVWYPEEDWFIGQCIDAVKYLSKAERIPIHWAVFTRYYQVFYDLSTVIGGLFAFRDEITLQQIRNRIFEKWGARNSLEEGLPKNMQMYGELQAVVKTEKPATYVRNVQQVSNVQCVQLLSASILERSEKSYMTWESIMMHPALFPFQIENVTQADMASCNYLTLERMGDEVVIRVKGN